MLAVFSGAVGDRGRAVYTPRPSDRAGSFRGARAVSAALSGEGGGAAGYYLPAFVKVVGRPSKPPVDRMSTSVRKLGLTHLSPHLPPPQTWVRLKKLIRFNSVSESFDSTELMTHIDFTRIDSNQL